jgi:hypothetical protein
MKTIRTILGNTAFVLFLVLCTGLAITLQTKSSISPILFQDAATNTALWRRTALLAILMIVGIVLGRLHARLAQLPADARINIVGELRVVTTTGGFWRSLLTAPVVFGVTYWMCQSQPDPIISSVLALENGFFCDVLFKRREDEISSGPRNRSQMTSAVKQGKPRAEKAEAK